MILSWTSQCGFTTKMLRPCGMLPLNSLNKGVDGKMLAQARHPTDYTTRDLLDVNGLTAHIRLSKWDNELSIGEIEERTKIFCRYLIDSQTKLRPWSALLMSRLGIVYFGFQEERDAIMAKMFL